MVPHTGYGRGMSDVPESDALEQAALIDDLPEPTPPHVDLEVPEADAIEQSQELPEVDEDYEA